MNSLRALLLFVVPLAGQGQVLTNGAGNALHVQSGTTLFVGGDLDNMGTLSGAGNVQATNLSGFSGTVAPGQSPGILSVFGTLNMLGTTYPCEINGTTAGTDYDVIAVSGLASLTSGAINVTWGFTPVATDQFTIMSFSSRTGMPAVNVPMVGGLTFMAVISSTGIVLQEISLPVGLFSFTANKQGDHAVLEWQTASEQNNKGFEVGRLQQVDFANVPDWKNIGFVAGNGTTTVEHRYSFVDGKPGPGTNYYRLRQMDFDGGEEYSKVVSVAFGLDEITVSPNPVTDVLTVHGNLGEGAAFEARDLTGRLKLSGMAADGLEINLADQPEGIYLIRILLGAQAITKIVVKQ